VAVKMSVVAMWFVMPILYAKNQVLTVRSEGELQIAANNLNKIAKICNMKISKIKTKAMGISGNNIERIKIEIDGKIFEQVSEFKYVGILSPLAVRL
jgi:hypothetical protein